MTPPSPADQAAARLLDATVSQLYRRGMLTRHDEQLCGPETAACVACLHDTAYRALAILADADDGQPVAVGEPIASAAIVRVQAFMHDMFPELTVQAVRHDRAADRVRGLLMVQAHQLRHEGSGDAL